MDVASKKIELTKNLLEVEDESILATIEKVLSFSNKIPREEKAPMTLEELNQRLDKSEIDFAEGRFISAKDLLSQYD